ncbi:MAG TPA: universal stress protein [Steroidobacteraceae bacterium]|nr:universal stress protein [Steroidobacteraceae bacterium]
MDAPVAEPIETSQAPPPVMRSILVVVDPTAGSMQPAVDKAVRLAASSGAGLELYICDVEQDIPDSWADSGRVAEYRELRRQQYLRELEAMAARIRAGGQVVTVACEWHAPLEEGIGHHVIRGRPDLVVKSTSRHAVEARVALTRTDWNLIRQIPASLLLVGPRPWSSQPRIAVAVDPGQSVEHPAHLDETLVEEGCELAGMLAGSLEIYHVLRNPPHLPGEPVPSQEKENAHAHARQTAQRLARRAGAAAVRVTEGGVTEGLTRLAAEHAPDVLVMGAVARPRWVHSAASGTAAQILERIACDLLVVKPPGFISPLLVTED